MQEYGQPYAAYCTMKQGKRNDTTAGSQEGQHHNSHRKQASQNASNDTSRDSTQSSKGSTRDEDIDLSREFAKVKKFFSAVNMETVVLCAFLLFAMALVYTVHMMPAALPATDDWAASTLQQNVRSQLAQEVDKSYPALPQDSRDKMINQRTADFIVQNQAQYDATRAELSKNFKSQLRYDANGKEYTYLGDLDSYFWLRYTRNILRYGHTCDVVRNGECMDMYILAPQGGTTSFNPSIHVFAIYGLYKFITVFSPGYPLPATSFLVPVIIGVLGVIPAFFIGRRLAGNIGGLFAAIVISLNQLVLSRSMGSDNDVWNTVIPLFIIWMVIEALEAKSTKGRVIFASLTGAFIGLHSATWEGYWFVYLIILFGLVAYLGVTVVSTFVRRHTSGKLAANAKSVKDGLMDPRIGRAALILAVFYIATFVFLVIANHGDGYFLRPTAIFQAGQALDRAVVDDYWPNVLTTVAELNKASITDAINQMGSQWYFFVALAGLLFMILPRKGWRLRHYLLFAGGAIVAIYLIRAPGISKFAALGLLMLPIAAILIAYLFEESDVDIAPALIILIWFLASVYASYSGVRFILLLAPAFGIAFAVAAGRAYEWVSAYLSKEIPWHYYITNVLLFIIIATLLVQPVRAGLGTARGFVPSIDDAWWDGLTKIDQEASKDAIINSWWDFGHWFKYVADRRVSADGTTQHTHAPRWLGLALVSPDESESVGVLRMLDCGNDAFPGPEGWNGAYGIVLKKLGDPIASQQIVRDIVALESKSDARAYLAKRGFTADEQTAVLNATHCDPPEDYFITSADMIGKAGVWAHFGLWNFTKAYVAQHSRTLPVQEAVADLQSRFGMSKEEAEKLYYDAKGLNSEGAINAFAAPWPNYITGSWMACKQSADNKSVVCPIGVATSQQGNMYTAIDSFTYNISSPKESGFSFGIYQNGRRTQEDRDGKPYSLIIAGETQMDEVLFNSQTPISVLYDAPNKRILLADPALVKSTFTQLYYLDGRYSKHFVKFYDRTGITGTRVLIWKVDWDGIESTVTNTGESASSGSAATIVRKNTTGNVTNSPSNTSDS